MLPPNAQTVFDAKKQQILESVRIIMQKGDDSDTGSRVAAILAEIQRNGVEIPHAIYNFSNSQIRLQNSIDEMITLMRHIQEEMCAIDTCRNNQMDDFIPLDHAIQERVLAYMGDEHQSHETVLRRIAELRADIQNPDSELNVEQQDSLNVLFSYPMQRMEFKVKIDKDPTLKQVWEENKAALENTSDPQHDAAKNQFIEALRQRALHQLDELEAEENSGDRRVSNHATFLDVMSDVVDTHRGGAMSKLGFASSAKYAVTSFINEKIWSGVQPKI